MKTYMIFVAMIVVITVCGCTYRPSSNSAIITGNDDKLYIATHYLHGISTPRVKVYDIIRNNWMYDIEFKEYDNLRFGNIIIKNNDVYVGVENIGTKPKSALYKINNDTSTEVIEFNKMESLVGIDNSYYYVIKKIGHDEEAFKYDIKTKIRYPNHIENIDIIVKDIYEDNDNYWYAGLRKHKKNNFGIMKYQLVLAKCAKNNNKYEIYEADSYNWDDWGRAVKIIEVEGMLYFFHKNGDFPVNREVNRFSKISKTFDKVNLPHSGTKPFSNVGRDGSVWLLDYPTNGHIKLLKLNIDTMKFDDVFHPNDILTNDTIYDDKDYLWIDAYKMSTFAFTGNTSPFLLKVSKNDLSYELIPVEPSFGQMIKTLFANAGSIIIAPFFRQ